MDRIENLKELVYGLLQEDTRYSNIHVPGNLKGLQDLLRALVNVRMPNELPEGLWKLQDMELQAQKCDKGVVNPNSIPPSPSNPRLRLWQGDITRLAVDAIVNAANSQMLGCFVPHHKCIDNAIHSAAGMQLREECASIMKAQGFDEPTGQAKITHGYNLPSKWVIHTVGPIVFGNSPTEEDCRLLTDCYSNCLKLAEEKEMESIAFCCISTGEFHFPQDKAAEIAIETVISYIGRNKNSSLKAIIFNVFKDIDYIIYKKLLGYD